MPNPGFILAEDAALKKRMAGIFVSDNRQAIRRCQVFYDHPNVELEKAYPYVTISLLDINFAPDRALSEQDYYYTNGSHLTEEQKSQYTSLLYYPSEMTEADLASQVDGDQFVTTEQFVPVDILYQVTTHLRDPIHKRQLDALMLRRVFPMRRGFIEIVEDGTMRRLTLLDWRSADILDLESGQNKHVFRSVYTLTINAEIPQADLTGAGYVETVEGTITNDLDPLTEPLMEDFT